MSRIGSNRRRTDGVRAVIFTTIHYSADSRQDPEHDDWNKLWAWTTTSRENHLHVNVQRYCMERRRNKEMFIANSIHVAEYARRFAHGHWSVLGPGSEKKWYGIHTYNPNGEWCRVAWDIMVNSSESGHSVFRGSNASERGVLKIKRKRKLSFHFCSDADTTEVFFAQSFPSVSSAPMEQQRMCATKWPGESPAVQKMQKDLLVRTIRIPWWCQQNCRQRTKRLGPMRLRKEKLLHADERKFTHLPDHLQLIKLCYNANIAKTGEKTIFHDPRRCGTWQIGWLMSRVHITSRRHIIQNEKMDSWENEDRSNFGSSNQLPSRTLRNRDHDQLIIWRWNSLQCDDGEWNKQILNGSVGRTPREPHRWHWRQYRETGCWNKTETNTKSDVLFSDDHITKNTSENGSTLNQELSFKIVSENRNRWLGSNGILLWLESQTNTFLPITQKSSASCAHRGQRPNTRPIWPCSKHTCQARQTRTTTALLLAQRQCSHIFIKPSWKKPSHSKHTCWCPWCFFVYFPSTSKKLRNMTSWRTKLKSRHCFSPATCRIRFVYFTEKTLYKRQQRRPNWRNEVDIYFRNGSKKCEVDPFDRAF